VSRVGQAGLVLAVLGVVLLGVGIVRAFDDGSSDRGSSDRGSSDAGTAASSSTAIARAVSAAGPASSPFPTLTQTELGVGNRTLRVVVADSDSERELGLRQRRDLGSYDGMLFAFPAASSDAFTMSTVPVALDVGFYDDGGRLVSRRRMEPCAGSESQCPLYRADHPYRYALETLAGALPSGSLH
jgi:uncharacterized membrane protein (UPF0127 family)